ncbi:hypothetical protein F8E02_10655 [Methanoculleus sp. Wushi-C6]|uniref:DUF4382 domain-containing protein n=1 Tax=Methanoculleus caldifontis TaxID=2651577 RepID=A0ABU3X4T9_9EURY|nr:hypothetical protein [Methanoculleus sp. Wushi-C6]MDV2482451.1 hypothetical protein [Methanoculleus sp. Wushi-C6]
MEIRAVGGFLVVISIVVVLLTAGCTSQLPPGNDQAVADAYPCSPLEVVPPIYYQGAPMDGSETAIAGFALNLTVIPYTKTSSTLEQDGEINITTIFITYTDGRDIYILKPGDYSIARRQSGDGDDALEPGEVVELILPVRQPIPANTEVYAEFWTPYHGTLTLALHTPDTIEFSGQIVEFTAAPFVSY